MASIEQRLDAIEARLARLEAQLATQPRPAPGLVGDRPPPPMPARTAPAAPVAQAAAPAARGAGGPPLATQLLGWGGAAALVLAASYVIKLAIASGWLTPERQIGMAVLGALAMIVLGLRLRNADRAYAGLLPAGGVAILFVATYGAHLYYGLMGAPAALAAVTLVCLLSLWLCHVFQSTLYAFFAVAGTYTVPFLMRSLMLDVTDLALYYACWSAVFGAFAVWVGSRAVYLLALYMAMIGFDFAWRDGSYADQWLSAVLFQLVLLVIFAVTAALYTVRRQQPLSQQAAWAHLPALLIFYCLQYSLLQQHIPAWAPWLAVASASVVALCYVLARQLSGLELAGGRLLLQAYLALVLFHAGYLESVPVEWAPWVALLLAPAVVAYAAWREDADAPGIFIWGGVAVIYLVNYLWALSGVSLGQVAAHDWLAPVYALQLYAGYVLARRAGLGRKFWPLLLLAGHLAAVAAAAQLLDSRIAVSLAWGLLALSCLLLALRYRDKLLGQSSLLVFAVSAAKVLLYDLASSAPLVRIGVLLVVGCSFYLGGWLYRRIEALE